MYACDHPVLGLLQERAEARNDVADKLGKLMQRWEQRITVDNPRFSDRFCTSQIHILLRLRGVNAIEDSVLVIEQGRSSSEVEQSCFADGNKVAVLVQDVELMQPPQSIIPAFVRFEFVDSILRWPENTLYFSSLFGWITLWGMRNRKLDFPSGFTASLAVIQADKNQLKCEMVESEVGWRQLRRFRPMTALLVPRSSPIHS
jgi:hypothetical protein